MMTIQELQDLQEGDLVLCLKTDTNATIPSFTAGKIYTIGGIYYKKCKLELLQVFKKLNEYEQYTVWENLVPIKKDNQGVSNGWKHTNFVSLKGKDLAVVKVLYGVE